MGVAPSDDAARSFLAKVRELVQQVVEGDFDQIEVYERQLSELETFIAAQAKKDVDADGDATRLLSAKEDELRLRALYAQQLPGYLAAPTDADTDLKSFLEKKTPKAMRPGQMNYGQNFPKWYISLQKAWWGDAATKDNDFAYD